MPVTYKCPMCGAAMVFDSKSGMLGCGQCGYKVSVDDFMQQQREFEQQQQKEQEEWEKEQQQNSDVQNEEPETMNVKEYHCSSCGAELMSDEFTSAVICSFCGNPSLVQDRLTGAYKPKFIIPFSIGKDDAKAAYKKWVKQGPLTPSELAKTSTIEKISGLYVPFWLYDYNSESRMTARAQRVRTSRRGDTEYIYTDHFHVYRDVENDFHGIPADASEKMNDDAMDKMEPYDYRGFVPFEMPYLSGYLSERYNYTHEQMQKRADERVERYITDITKSTIVGYSSVNVISNMIRKVNTKCDYVLMPVWVLNCRYKDKDFHFMMNGQTGKIVADRPISGAKTVVWSIAIFVVALIAAMMGGLIFV